jgi:hypothetical protein
MRVILNSDVLFTSRLIRGRLPGHIERFAKECGRLGTAIVLPRTVILEVERRQEELVEEERANLEAAYATLKRAGVEFEHVAADKLFVQPDVAALLTECGVRVEIEEPTLEDYTEAERRACLHLAPQSPTAESDEMRDLVIWMLAGRVARREGGAILVSRDEVHTHGRGDGEATEVGLQRARDFDDALEILGAAGAPGILARRLLVPLWEDLRKAGLPLSPDPSIRMVSGASFVQGEAGIRFARLEIKARTDKGGELKAMLEIHRDGEVVRRVIASNVSIDGNRWGRKEVVAEPNRQIDLGEEPAEERLRALRDLLGEGQ